MHLCVGYRPLARSEASLVEAARLGHSILEGGGGIHRHIASFTFFEGSNLVRLLLQFLLHHDPLFEFFVLLAQFFEHVLVKLDCFLALLVLDLQIADMNLILSLLNRHLRVHLLLRREPRADRRQFVLEFADSLQQPNPLLSECLVVPHELADLPHVAVDQFLLGVDHVLQRRGRDSVEGVARTARHPSLCFLILRTFLYHFEHVGAVRGGNGRRVGLSWGLRWQEQTRFGVFLIRQAVYRCQLLPNVTIRL